MINHSQSPSSPQDSSLTATIVGLEEGAIQALIARGIDIELVSRLGWRSSTRQLSGELPIEIPYLIDGKEVNVKYRTLIGKSFSQEKDGVKCFYNMEALKDWAGRGMDLLITEGEMDCVVALQFGYLAVSVPDGAPSQSAVESASKYSYTEGFPKGGTIILCTDADSQGQVLANDLAELLGVHRVKIIAYPKGCKDLNEVLLKYGEKGIHETIKRAQWFDKSGVSHLKELKVRDKPEFRPLNFVPINLRRGEFSVFTGVPSTGKSTMMNSMALEIANGGWKTAYASFEQKPQTYHKYALRNLFLGKKSALASDGELELADEWIDSYFRFIVSDDDIDLAWLLNTMAKGAVQHGVDWFIIDPWNELDHGYNRKEMSLTEYTGFAIKKLKEFANKFNVHVTVVAHPAKMQRGKDGRYPIPSLYDIADSAHWYNKPDLGVILHIDDNGNTVFKVAKSRDHEEIGKPDEYILEFDTETKKYSPVNAIYSLA